MGAPSGGKFDRERTLTLLFRHATFPAIWYWPIPARRVSNGSYQTPFRNGIIKWPANQAPAIHRSRPASIHTVWRFRLIHWSCRLLSIWNTVGTSLRRAPITSTTTLAYRSLTGMDTTHGLNGRSILTAENGSPRGRLSAMPHLGPQQ